jgi:hypothetical protein
MTRGASDAGTSVRSTLRDARRGLTPVAATLAVPTSAVPSGEQVTWTVPVE